MLKIVKHGDLVQATSQYNEDDVTNLIPVTFVDSSASNGNDGLSLVAEALGTTYAGLGSQRQVTLAVKEEAIGEYAVGTIIPGLFINREWCDENPYPKAVDKKGKPLAAPMTITHPEFGELELYSRTFIAKTKVADTFNLVGEYDVVNNNAPGTEDDDDDVDLALVKGAKKAAARNGRK